MYYNENDLVSACKIIILLPRLQLCALIFLNANMEYLQYITTTLMICYIVYKLNEKCIMLCVGYQVEYITSKICTIVVECGDMFMFAGGYHKNRSKELFLHVNLTLDTFQWVDLQISISLLCVLHYTRCSLYTCSIFAFAEINTPSVCLKIYNFSKNQYHGK